MRIHYSAALQALCACLAAALPALCPAAPLELRWRAEASDPKPYSASVFRGETVALSASLYAYNEPAALDPASACTLYWQTNGMGSAWWECPGAASTNGALSATWSPANDVGASLYSFFLSAETPSGRIYRARGTLRMLDSPGWNPAAAPPPSCYPDLAAGLVPHVSPLLDALYAPAWAGVAAHTNAPAIHLTPEQADKIAHSITSAPPQTVVSVNGQTGEVSITAASIGALTNETDTAALAALAAHSAYWPPNATASSWFTFVTNSGAITITDYNIAGGTAVIIPDYINGWPVTTIGVGAFAESSVTSIGGAGNVVTVGNAAFSSCFSLASVSLPQAQTVGEGAFVFCQSLASVSLPQAQTVGDYAFGDCSSLASVYFDNDTPTIGAEIFPGLNPNQVTNYVTNPQATGWGATFGGMPGDMPVVRLPLYGDKIYQAGELVATTGHVAQAIAAMPVPDMSSRVAVSGGTATNLTTRGWLALPQTVAGTNLTYRLVVSNDVILAIGVWE